MGYRCLLPISIDFSSLCHCFSTSQGWVTSVALLVNLISSKSSTTFEVLSYLSAVTLITLLSSAFSLPLAIGDIMRRLTQTAPCPWPKMETFDGSPPNSCIFSCIQWRAATWSIRPKFPRELPSKAGKNPEGEIEVVNDGHEEKRGRKRGQEREDNNPWQSLSFLAGERKDGRKWIARHQIHQHTPNTRGAKREIRQQRERGTRRKSQEGIPFDIKELPSRDLTLGS